MAIIQIPSPNVASVIDQLALAGAGLDRNFFRFCAERVIGNDVTLEGRDQSMHGFDRMLAKKPRKGLLQRPPRHFVILPTITRKRQNLTAAAYARGAVVGYPVTEYRFINFRHERGI